MVTGKTFLSLTGVVLILAGLGIMKTGMNEVEAKIISAYPSAEITGTDVGSSGCVLRTEFKTSEGKTLEACSKLDNKDFAIRETETK